MRTVDNCGTLSLLVAETLASVLLSILLDASIAKRLTLLASSRNIFIADNRLFGAELLAWLGEVAVLHHFLQKISQQTSSFLYLQHQRHHSRYIDLVYPDI